MVDQSDKAKWIFLDAIEKSTPAQRDAYLDEACVGDPALRARVDKLLWAQKHLGSFHEAAGPPLAATVDELVRERPGTVIGTYKLLEQIGEGGMGLVFVAEQDRPVRRRVALKIIKPGMDSRQVVARFEAERQALAMMDHANIAKVHDGGTTPEGRPYFVMELVKGKPITAYCDANRLTTRQRLELFLDVCHAVQHAHQKGIIHRDIKPSNVLVSIHDVKPVVKVIDFGIAKAVGGQLTDKTVYTAVAQLIGTPLYMSPEQAGLSDLDVDTRSDVYSLGVLLYELLTGTTPFDSETLKKAGYDEMRRIIREDEPLRPSARLSTMQQAHLATIAELRGLEPHHLSRHLRGELDWIVMRALEKDRNRRYESASAFAADVQRYLNDEPVQACPPSMTYRLRKFVRRKKAGLGVAACFLAVFAVLSGGIGWVANDRATRAQRTADEISTLLKESADRQQRRRLPEALSAARRANGALAGGHADPALCRQVEARVNDLDLLARLEEARLESTAVKDGHFDGELVDRRYGEIFREFHLDLEDWSAEEAGRHVRESTIALELAAVLDEWAVGRRFATKQDEARWMHLLDVARAADPDGWRTQLRDALSGKDRKSLVSLASSDKAACLLPWTWNAVGRTLQQAGDAQQAEALLRKAQHQHPEDFWINEVLAEVIGDLQLARAEERISFLRVCVALRPQSPGAHVNLGIALAMHHKGDVDGSIAEFREAIRLKEDYAEAHCNLGNALYFKKDLAGAIAEYNLAISLKKHVTAFHYNLAVALEDKEDMEGAIAVYREAMRLNKDDPETHHKLAAALNSQGHREEAIAEYREAIRLKKDFAEAHCNLGYALRDQGQFAEALTSLRRGHELGSKNPRWPYPSADWVRQAERLVELDAKLSRILKRQEQPANVGERQDLARMCVQYKNLPVAASTFFREAFAEQPRLADNLNTQDRYNAACAAALAGCGQGKDADQTDDKERARLRQQARDWLRADLAAWQKVLEKQPEKVGPVVTKTMLHWQQDTDFAGVRGPEALAKLPEGERADWQKLWAEVERSESAPLAPAKKDAIVETKPELVPLPREVP